MPVRDLEEARHFYVDVLGCEPGRVMDRAIDVFFFGAQVTLHERPAEVSAPEHQGVRHFGVALTAPQWRALVDRLEAEGAVFLRPARHGLRRHPPRAAQGHGGGPQRQRHRAQDLRRPGRRPGLSRSSCALPG